MPPYTPLLRPDRFFAERDISRVRMLVIALLAVATFPLAMWGVEWILRAHIDGTVMVDNPDRPSEPYCEVRFMNPECDAPAHVERNFDAALSEALGQFTELFIVVSLVMVVLIGGLLHAGSWLVDGENGVRASFAVALWGQVPGLLGLVFTLGLAYVLLDPMTVTPDSDLAVLADRIRTDLQPLVTWGPLLSGVITLWSGIIWRFGLQHKRGLTGSEATAVAGSVAVGFWLLSFF